MSNRLTRSKSLKPAGGGKSDADEKLHVDESSQSEEIQSKVMTVDEMQKYFDSKSNHVNSLEVQSMIGTTRFFVYSQQLLHSR